MAHKKKFRYFLLVDNFHFRLVTMTFKFPNTKVITFFFSFVVAEDRALYFEPAQKSIVSHYMRMWSCKVEAEYHDFWDKIPFSQRLLFGDHTADKEPK